MELHGGLPRQAPGSDATTRRLLSLCGPLPERPRVLDLGCGPGRSALLLAAEAGGAGLAEVTAVDLHQPFLDELRTAAEDLGLDDRVHPVRADMAALPFEDGSFDLVWAEGSAYVIGFDAALAAWKRLLAPGGTLVVTECEWTVDEPSAGARAFWDAQYALRSTARNVAAAQAAGYRILGVHPLPDADWDAYYGPLRDRVRDFAPSTPARRAALGLTREELDVRARHGHEYGYTGHVLAPVTAGGDGRWPVRPETPADAAAVRAVNLAAFGTPLEADLVDALRADGSWLPGLSYVAGAPDGSVAAHALLTRCTVDGAPALALAPVAADPAVQRSGAGSAVVRALLAAARERGESLVLVLGHPAYYPRFGFVPASRFGIRAPFEVPDAAMMALVLDDRVPVPAGTIAYPAPFGV
ncbi:bifunctional class I SAM-dependent methyltransferase/N-acetyltransferase [Streptomyces sp. NPDC006512]|uniref:bifunctional class I SAM-dependent methyltransferase/N-acetyltransferase n=1 Tax=Streptomyces sp. NPDC006512 TaxID=3154307 RepID=UPI0033B46412